VATGSKPSLASAAYARAICTAVTVISCEDRLCFGLNADFDRVPDLHRFTAALERSFAELARAAGEAPALELVREAGARSS